MCHRRHQELISEVALWIVAARESPEERGRAGVRCFFFFRIDQQTSGPNEAAKNAPRLYFYRPRPIDRKDFISGFQGFPPPSERG
jgi:hypothetical protein